MADTDVPKVPASGLTGSAPVAKKSAPSTIKTTSTAAASKATASHAKTAQTKPSTTVKPGLTKASSKTSLLNPSSINQSQKALSTSKTNLEIKQSVDNNSKKTEQQRSSASLNSLTSKSGGDSKLTAGKLNKSTPSLDTLKGTETSVELKKLAKSSDLNKVSSSVAVDSKPTKMDSSGKDSKPAQKVVTAASKKAGNTKPTKGNSNLEGSKLDPMSEVNITSTVSDEELSYQNVSAENVGESAVKLSIESDSSNESFEVISISEAKSERTSPLLVEDSLSDSKSIEGQMKKGGADAGNQCSDSKKEGNDVKEVDSKKDENVKNKEVDLKKGENVENKVGGLKKDENLKNKEGELKKDENVKNKEGELKKDENVEKKEGDLKKDENEKNKEDDLKKDENEKNKEFGSKKFENVKNKEVDSKKDNKQKTAVKDKEVDVKSNTTTPNKDIDLKTGEITKNQVEDKKDDSKKVLPAKKQKKDKDGDKNKVENVENCVEDTKVVEGVCSNKDDTTKKIVEEKKVDKLVKNEGEGLKNVVKDGLQSGDGLKKDGSGQSADVNKKIDEDKSEKITASSIKLELHDLLDTDKVADNHQTKKIIFPNALEMPAYSVLVANLKVANEDDKSGDTADASTTPLSNLSSSVSRPKGSENDQTTSNSETNMSTPSNSQPLAPNAAAAPAASNEESKHAIRMQVWNSLDKKRLVNFPRPCKGRIPHFIGSSEAADKLAELDVFKNAKSVQVNPDKPQSYVRYHTLKTGKQLLIPNPSKTSGFLLKAEATTENVDDKELMFFATQQGIRQIGKPVELKDDIKVDLVVIGAVAVSKEGYVIGRGHGYSDLEYALMMSQGIITKDTVVACTVHDDQVFDTLPKHLFTNHDVPVDLIVTPTQVIEVEKKLEKPTGIIWNKVSNRRITKTPVLTMIRDEEVKEDKDCTLKEEDSDLEEDVRPYYRRYNNRYNSYQRRNFAGGRGGGRGRGRGGRGRGRGRGGPPRGERVGRDEGDRRRTVGEDEENNDTTNEPATAMAATNNGGGRGPPRSRKGRTYSRNNQQTQQNNNNNRSNSRNQRKSGRHVANSEEKAAGGDASRPSPYQQRNGRFGRKPPMPIEFIMKVSGLTRGMRVRDLKAALSERQVKPYDITWLASDGQAYLLFAKDLKNSKPNIVTELSPVNVVEGFPAKLEFKIEGPPRRHKLDWTVNGKSLDTNKGRIKVATKADGTVRLLIDKVEADDSGEYAVTVKNSIGQVTSKAAVVVAEKKKPDLPEAAPQFVSELQEVSLDERACLTLAAQITGNPIPEVEWSKDGVTLSPNDRMQFSCDGSNVCLELNLCRVIDSGVYKCKLTNSLGSVESSAKVTISRPKKRMPNLPQAAINPDSLDMINVMMDKMRDLKIKSEGEESAQSLSVELASPVSRIESIEVSAV